MSEQRLDQRGQASGWNVTGPHPDGSYHWSSFGPTGGDYGTARTKVDAETRARTSEERLKAVGRRA